MESFVVLFKKEVTEIVKTHKLTITMAIFLAMGLLIPPMIKFLPEMLDMIGVESGSIGIFEPTALSSLDSWFVGTLVMLCTIVPAFVVMGSIAKERSEGITAVTLVKPVGRGAYVLSKLFAYSLLFILATFVSSMVVYVMTIVMIEDFAFGSVMAATCINFILCVLATALTLFFSSILKSSLAAGGISAGIMFIIYIFFALPEIGYYTPMGVELWASDILKGEGEVPWISLATCIVGTIALAGGAIQVLKKKEI